MRCAEYCEVVANRPVATNQLEIEIHCPTVALHAQPGQFVQMRVQSGYEPLFSRPFSVFRRFPERGNFSVVYLARGTFTRMLAAKKPGETVFVVGPLGNRFSLRQPANEILHVLVAGGVGAPPLYLLAEEMVQQGIPRHRIVVVNGARRQDLLVCQEHFAELGVHLWAVTEDGSLGERGKVTDVLKSLHRRGELPHDHCQIYACGPTAMLEAVAQFAHKHHLRCQVSMETLMPCGLGVCLGCAVKVRTPQGTDYKRACVDGPIFDATEVVWK
ncbi:MAG: dihydroorotate dehydrogenase B (NAD(+)), electron transfer subunit [Armatimonadota bacterium]|nr:MAG: dihydroorotate dehydrogenase B (NAD(+)), electron transfer subunit [Armatimonadota bacterium]